MTIRPPFMTKPWVDLLEGQQYVVLRPDSKVADSYQEVQAALKAILPATATYPNTGHVTLGGFGENDKIEDLKRMVEEWASHLDPITVEIVGVDSFPAPFKVIILTIKANSALKHAYTTLADLANKYGLQPIGVQRSVDEWIFHMSLAYCGELTDNEWEASLDQLSKLVVKQQKTIVNSCELAWYHQGEHSIELPLHSSSNSRES